MALVGRQAGSKGTFDVEVEVTADDEYRELGLVFNEMVTNLRTKPAGTAAPDDGERAAPDEPAAASGAAQARGGNAEAAPVVRRRRPGDS